ncbi:GNAT family N-acetyltransferase [Tateyamaria armeniaca]|uniref:GNAT family N-acetyltransferase n=1 Tax=Tateyamaria armeniaca TaxID=2518930 RepID=A0ABW8URU4_9RHOB
MDIIYGSPAQVGIVQRAAALHRLIGDDPRFTYQGRTVSLVGETPEAAGIVTDLVRLQGYSSVQFLPRAASARIQAHLAQAGLNPVEWEQFWGQDSALEAARDFLAGYSPPDGLELCETDADTDDDTIHRICAMSQDQGVLTVPGSVMRGAGPRGVMMYVRAPDGAVVAAGGGYMSYHPDSVRATEAFWGMLATAPDWRGKRLACWVGATVILRLAERYGARGFSSGVKADNAASQAMCTRLGLIQSEFVYSGATDPAMLGDGPITR